MLIRLVFWSFFESIRLLVVILLLFLLVVWRCFCNVEGYCFFGYLEYGGLFDDNFRVFCLVCDYVFV